MWVSFLKLYAFRHDEIIFVVISALELTSRNILCGSVRLIYAIIYTFFLVGTHISDRITHVLPREAFSSVLFYSRASGLRSVRICPSFS